MRGCRAIIAGAICLSGATDARAESDARGLFLRAHRCAIVARLERIHARGPVETSRDRFIAVGLRDWPQHYAQCIFIDRDAAMVCEASSGANRRRAYAAERLDEAPWSVAALEALGFRQADRAENFAQEIRLGDPPDLAIAADLMLGALYDGYGARTGMALTVTAPRGHLPRDGCGTPGS